MDPYATLRPILFRLPAERAHALGLLGLRAASHEPLRSLVASRYGVDDDRLAVDRFGCAFPNPVGVAAGFDKNARAPRGLAALGFGHVEVGGVTAEPQAGNPRPRLFRLPTDRAIVNRMGFNNDGADAVGARLSSGPNPSVPVGVNLGKSKSASPAEAPDDYAYTYRQVADGGDYFVVNVSSPNTPGLRDLQDREPLREILTRLREAGAEPLLVKLSPDLHREAIADAVDLAETCGLDGIVATNTTTEREGLAGDHADEEGGLSGRPLENRATEVVRFVAGRTDLPVIGVGGVATAADAYRKIRAGACIVQLYTALVYEGPSVAREINRGLLDLLERDGFDDVEDAIGADLD